VNKKRSPYSCQVSTHVVCYWLQLLTPVDTYHHMLTLCRYTLTLVNTWWNNFTSVDSASGCWHTWAVTWMQGTVTGTPRCM